MKLEEVLPAFKQGKKIRRRAWEPKVRLTIFDGALSVPLYYDTEKEMICSHTPDYIMDVNKDILAEDWEVVE